MSSGAPDPERDRERFAERLRDAGLDDRRFINVPNGKKGGPGNPTNHQNPENWRAPNDDRLSGNYGVHPGAGEHGGAFLVEFDVDDYDDVEDTDALDALEETFAVESPHTPAGESGHHYYRVDADDVDVLEELTGTLNPEPAWGEIKADRKYVVGPGSQLDGCTKEWCDKCDKSDGGYYRIANDVPIATISRDDLEEVIRADSELGNGTLANGYGSVADGAATEDKTPTPEPPKPPSEGVESDDSDEYDEYLTDDDIAEALSHVPKSLGYTEWMKIAFAVHDYDDSGNGKELFINWSSDGAKWDSDSRTELDKTWKAASRNTRADDDKITLGYLVKMATLRGWDKPSPPAGSSTASNDGGRSSRLTQQAVMAVAGLDEDETVGDLNDRPKAAVVWELVVDHDDVHLRVRRDNGSLWAYDDGIWKPEGERALRHAGRQALGSWNYGANVLSELKVQARGDPTVEVDEDAFGLDTGTVAVENGLVSLDMAANGDGFDALRDLRPDDLALTRLPVEYDPTAEYDEWASLVEEWAEEDKADALQEYVGYCLHIGALPIHRALLLVGAGANGKGTFLTVVRALLGEDNTSSTELQTLANEKDAVADFYGALANIDDDLSTRKLGQGKGMFKKLVGGDRVRARQLYEGGFEFDAVGKHLYAANEVPKVDVPDNDEAFWRRWLLIEFPNFYPPDERDPQLRDRLTDDESLSGVLNWAIEGWRRLLDQGYFTNEEQMAAAKRRRWQSWGDSVDEFISECVSRDENAPRMTTGQAHARYAAWCDEQGDSTDAVKQQPFTVRLKAEDVGYGRLRIDGKSQRGYEALGLSDDVPEVDDSSDDDDPDDSTQERL
jgi:putative DNA primase/helicase